MATQWLYDRDYVFRRYLGANNPVMQYIRDNGFIYRVDHPVTRQQRPSKERSKWLHMDVVPGQWCFTTIGDQISWFFTDETAALMFKLRWGNG